MFLRANSSHNRICIEKTRGQLYNKGFKKYLKKLKQKRWKYHFHDMSIVPFKSMTLCLAKCNIDNYAICFISRCTGHAGSYASSPRLQQYEWIGSPTKPGDRLSTALRWRNLPSTPRRSRDNDQFSTCSRLGAVSLQREQAFVSRFVLISSNVLERENASIFGYHVCSLVQMYYEWK